MPVLPSAAALSLMALSAFATDSPSVVGGLSSRDGIEIDGTWMGPSPSWPVIDKDVIRTSDSTGLLLTKDRNAIILMPRTRVRVRTFPPQQTWIFVEQGGLTVQAKTSGVFICIAEKLFEPSASASASLELKQQGMVAQSVQHGTLSRIKVERCSEENAAVLAAGSVVASAGVAAGSVAGTAAVAGGTATAAAAGATSAAAATIGAVGGATAAASLAATTGSSASTTCTTPAGCNFNPPPISASTP